MTRVAPQLLGTGVCAPGPPAAVLATARGAAVAPLGGLDLSQAEGHHSHVWTGRRSYLLRETLAAVVRLDGARRLVTTEESETVTVGELTSGTRFAVSRRQRRLALSSALRRPGGVQ